MKAETKIKLQDFQDPRWPSYSVDADFLIFYSGNSQDWSCNLSLDSAEVQLFNAATEFWERRFLSFAQLPLGLQLSVQSKALEKATDLFNQGKVEFLNE